MKKDSDPPKPKLKLSLSKKTGENGSPTPTPRPPKVPPPVARDSKNPTTRRKNAKTESEIAPSIELEPADEVFWEVFEMVNLGFPQKRNEPHDISDGRSPSEPELERDKATPDPGESGPRMPKLRTRDTPPAKPPPPPVQTFENASLDDFVFDEEHADADDFSHFGADMLIGDSEDQIARGPGRLTPEEERPKRPPPPLDAPVLPLSEPNDRKPRRTEQADEQDEIEFFVTNNATDANRPEDRNPKDREETEASPPHGHRFWVTLGLVAAIAGASAFTLSTTREGRPIDEQAARNTPAVSTPVRVTESSALSVLIESPDDLRSPETTAALQSLVDGFLISVTYPSGNRPRIVINEVTVPVGAVIDPYATLRLVQIQEEPRTLIFEDGGGQTYTRPF